MKLNKRKVFVSALVICLIAILSFSTLAWFTDTKSIENIFKVSTEDDNMTPDFKISLYENEVDEETGKAKDTDEDGDIDDDDAITTTGNTYDSVLPGDSLYKNPTVKNMGQYDQYIRVYVTLTRADKWVPTLAKYDLDIEDIIGGYDGNVWRSEIVDADYTDGTVTNVYYLKSVLEPEDKATLFTSVNIPGELTKEDMTFLGGQFELSIEAQAIQAENTKDNAYDAFAAYWGN